jgi:hypothetical protein
MDWPDQFSLSLDGFFRQGDNSFFLNWLCAFSIHQ